MKNIILKNVPVLLIIAALVFATSCNNDPTPAQGTLAIASIAPTSGGAGTAVVLTGTGFSATASENTVTLNGKPCPIINATITQLQITIPANAGSGNITVTTAGHTAQSANFDFIFTIATVSTLAGSTSGYADGNSTTAQFYSPLGVATDAAGNVYVADTFNNRIRKITPAGIVTTLAGSTLGYADGTGTTAQFFYPSAVAIDAAGNVYVADTNNNKIRKITPAGNVTTLAGSTYGYANGTGTTAQFSSPQGVAIDAAGNVYVADTNNNKIRKITPAGTVTTLAGSTADYTDGNGAAAKFFLPRGVATDALGNVYVADTNNNRIRKITPAGIVTTLAGSTAGFGDGTGTAAKFSTPSSVAVDASGNVYVADTDRCKIRKITPAGIVTTLAGSTYGYANGTGTTAQFENPQGIAIDASGNIYVADSGNQMIRKITM